MAYRFNPPPNWPIEDPDWSPPPGWQPDPSWGPAPEGWNFWTEASSAPVSSDAPDAAPSEGEGTPGDADAHGEADRAGGQDAVAEDPDATHVASTDQRTEHPAPEVFDRAGDDDATRIVSTDQHRSADQNVADDAAAAGAAAGAPAPGLPDAAPGLTTAESAAPSGSAETAEYEGPDLDSDLAQQAPYEGAGTNSEQPSGDARASHAVGAGEASSSGFGGASAAASSDGAPAYGQSSSAAYDQGAPAGYGQASPAGYGHASPAGYGQASPAGYGQASPAPYGAQGYGQTSAGEYPGPLGTVPGAEGASAWSASTGGSEPPKKGVVARFWWVGCIALFLVFLLIVAVVGGVLLFNRGGDSPTGGSPTTEQSTSAEPTDEETIASTPTAEETTEEEREVVTPTNVPPVDPAAEEVAFVSMDGSGTIAISMEWVADTELPDEYGDTVEPNPKGPEYLVMTGRITVTEGTVGLNPYQFEVMTPYGGAITYSVETLSLEGSGFELDAPDEFEAGEEYTFRLLFPAQRAGGMTLEFDTYTDMYSWDVPA